MKVDVDVLGTLFLMVRTVSVDLKQHLKKQNTVSKLALDDGSWIAGCVCVGPKAEDTKTTRVR